MSEPIKIKVVAEGTGEASNNLDKVGGSLDRMRAKSQESAGGIGELRGALMAAGFMRAATEIKQLAEEGDALADAMSQLRGHSIELARDVTQHLIPSFALATNAGRLLTAEVAFTDEQFAAAAAAAQVFALRTGTDGSAALDRLTGALVQGNARGLRPFGIALQEGQSGAAGTAEALRQLSTQLDANTANIAANTGGIDRLGAAYHTARESLGTFEAGIVETIVAAHDLLAELVTLPVTLGQGEDGFNQAADAASRFAAALPIVGDAAENAVGQVLDLARAHGLLAYNIARASTAEQRAAVAGSADPGLQNRRQRYQMGRDLDRDQRIELAGQQYDAISDALQPAAGGGGGGGGGGAMALTHLMSDTLEEIRERDRAAMAAWLQRYEEEQAEIADQLARRGPSSSWESATAGRFVRPSSTTQNTSTIRATAKPIDEVAAAYERLGTRGKSVLDSLNSAWESHFAAFSKGEESFSKAMKGMASAALESIATQSLQEAGFQVAKGIGSLAAMDYPGAALHFASAAAFGLIAGGAYAGSAAVAPGSSSRSSAGGDSFRTPTSSTSLGQRSANDGGGNVFVFNLAPGAIVGGGDARATQDWLRSQIDEGTTRANRIRRLAA